MDPILLGEGLARTVVVEIDWVVGCEPGPLTVEGLAAILRKYGPRERLVEIVRDDAIPRAEWDALAGPDDETRVEALVRSHANPFVEQGVEHRYVLFAPGSRAGYNGYSTSWVIERDGTPRQVHGVVVFRAAHTLYARLWISLDKLERMTLVHEFGHQFGLVADPRHERRHPDHRGHCTRLDCAMAHPTGRVIWRNVHRGVLDVWFKDYCRECQAEIRTAQAEWRRERAANPDWVAEQHARSAARVTTLGLRVLWESEDFAGLLREADARLADDPGSEDLASYRLEALLGLDRIDEALAAAAKHPAQDPQERARRGWFLGRALIGAGRHPEVPALFEGVMDTRGESAGLGDGEVEQTSFVLLAALTGMGRFSDAPSICSRLLGRLQKTEMQRYCAELWRRAGDLERAAALVAPLVRKSAHPFVLEEAAAIEEARGNSDRARSLLAQAARPAPKKTAASTHDRYVRARILARLGRSEEARAVLAEAAALEVEGRRPVWAVLERAAALAWLGDHEEAAALLRRLTPAGRRSADPCSAEWLERWRSDPRYAGALAHCPAP